MAQKICTTCGRSEGNPKNSNGTITQTYVWCLNGNADNCSNNPPRPTKLSNATIICYNCGYPNDNNANVCGACGVKL